MAHAATSAARKSTRVAWIDGAKGLGMLAVYFGHFVESFAGLNAPGAATQMRWIYTFHIPLFFFLSGLVQRPPRDGFGRFVARRAVRLLVPVVTFNAIGMVLWVVVMLGSGASVSGVLDGVRDGWTRFGLEGLPVWSTVTWFLTALFVVEIVHAAVRPLLRTDLAVVLAALVFVAATWGLAEGGLMSNPWYLRSALAGLVFYELGVLVARRRWLHDGGRPRAILVCAAALAIFVATVGLNPIPIPLMVAGWLGDVPLFFVAATAGTLAVAALARTLPAWRPLVAVGAVTLPLLGLNGVLVKLVNLPLARGLLGIADAPSAWYVAAACAAYTVLALALLVPVARLLERRLPFLVGRPRR